MEGEKEESWAGCLCSYLGLIITFSVFILIITPRPAKLPLKDPSISVEATKLDNCNRPLLQICTSMRDAVDCNVTPYCIHCNWATDFNPNDAIDEKCSRCMHSLHPLYEETNNATDGKPKENYSVHESYKNILKPICNFHISTGAKESCIKNMEHYFSENQEYWSINPRDLSKLEICSILGMCYIEFTLFLPKDSNVIKLEEASESNLFSHHSIQKVPGAKLDLSKPNEEKEAGKFLPVFKTSCAKHVCMFRDLSESKNYRKWTLILGAMVVVIGFFGTILMKKSQIQEDSLEKVTEVEEEIEIESDEQEPMTSKNNFAHFNAIMAGEVPAPPSAGNNVDNDADIQNNPYDVQNVVEHIQNVIEDMHNGIEQADLEN